jgi:hypothetical protein
MALGSSVTLRGIANFRAYVRGTGIGPGVPPKRVYWGS